MEIHARFVAVGAIVLALVGFAFLFVLNISSERREYDQYDIVFRNQRVSGLNEGAQVRFQGIVKGEVQSLTIDPEDPAIVIARVRVEKNLPVKTDTTAELEPVGFTGLLIIQLVGGTKEADHLKDVSEERIPTIDAGAGGLNAFLQGTGDLVAQAQKLLSDQNIAGIGSIINNVETMTAALADKDEEIASIVENAEKLTEDLASITEKLDGAAASVEKILEGDAAETMAEVEAVVSEARGLIEDLRGIMEENRSSVRVFADQGLGQVAPALSEARRLMRSLDYMLREIDRDPQAYFLGERAPEYGAEE